jgi:hypothetical protein
VLGELPLWRKEVDPDELPTTAEELELLPPGEGALPDERVLETDERVLETEELVPPSGTCSALSPEALKLHAITLRELQTNPHLNVPRMSHLAEDASHTDTEGQTRGSFFFVHSHPTRGQTSFPAQQYEKRLDRHHRPNPADRLSAWRPFFLQVPEVLFPTSPSPPREYLESP